MQTETTFHSMKNSSSNFGKFALTNGTAFSKIYELKGRFPFDQIKIPVWIFWNFPWANGTDFSIVKNDKPNSFVRVEFFIDF